ncbi:MAG TPA: DUF2079 domain-containing protein, partial [Methylomirabilota bacterium]|nr:DUF2079 domain-containing protein [Methylomirabilota bacterium]
MDPRRAVAAGVLAYVALMGFLVVTRHVGLRTHALDLGYYVQLVWSIAHGHGARVTLPPMHAWGDHFSPVLYVLAPLGRLPAVAEALLLAQTAIFAAGGLAVFGFAARRLGDPRAGAAFAAVYLLNPSLHGMNVRDVHPAAFAVPLLVAAALAFDAGRPGWCALAVALALAGREDAAVAGVGFAAWLALARGRWALGTGVAAACLALLWIDLNLVLPYFRGEPYPHLQRYRHLGATLPEVLAGLLLPWRWLTLLADLERVRYVLALLAPLAFLPLLAPRALAAALPGLAMNLLASDPILFHHRTQYQAYVLPFLVLAAVEGYAALARRRGEGGRLARLGPATPLVAALLLSLALTSRTVNGFMVTRWWPAPEVRALRALVARVEPAAPVSV